MVLILTKQDLESVLDIKSTIEAVELGYRERALGTAQLPPRVWVNIPKHGGRIGAMPAYLGEMDAFGVKIPTVYPSNPKIGHPTVGGTMVLADSKTGLPISIMDGTYITAARTGAAAAVATRYLAIEDAEKAAVIGAGVIGKSTLASIASVKKLRSATVYDVFPEAAEKFAEEMKARLDIEISPSPDPNVAVHGAQIVVTATTSVQPVFGGEQVSPGMHINSMGWISPESRELDSQTVKRADKIVLDFRDDAIEAADIRIPINEGLLTKNDIFAEIGEVVSAKKTGRTSDTEVTIFKSVGMAVTDVSTAKVAYDLAKKKGVGKEVTL